MFSKLFFLARVFKLLSLFIFLNINFVISSVIAQAPKIVGLMAVRNEAQIIANSLQALSLYTDEIIVLDDASTDNTVAVVKSLQVECHITKIIEKEHWYRDEPGDKNKLLAAGRAIGGTHFIMLDADEIFTANLLENNLLKNKILALKPGDKLTVTLINLWRSPDFYRYDSSVWSGCAADVIFCDDGKCAYDSAFLHTPRTPADLVGTVYDLALDDHIFDIQRSITKQLNGCFFYGAIEHLDSFSNVQLERCLKDQLFNYHKAQTEALDFCRVSFLHEGNYSSVSCHHRDFTAGLMHFQFVNWDNLLIKQAWYRCLEKIRDPNVNITEINRKYGESKQELDLRCLPIPASWFIGYQNFLDKKVYLKAESWQKKQVLQWFKQYGQEFFKDLDIWDIDWAK